MIRRLLVANRGEIAVRVARGAREMGIVPVGIYSEADAGAYHLRFMDDALCVGPAPAVDSYLNVAAVVAAAKTLRADAVHPGYGFLSERAEFAAAVRDAGIFFVGPGPESMAAMGSKIEAKRRVREFNVPVVPGYDGDDQSKERLRAEAHGIGTPLLIKASAGGGGRGMRVVDDLAAFDEALDAAKREAKAAFGDDAVLLERYLRRPRHIEFQILADQHGNIVHFGERECSIQRRHQKIVEEAPSVAVDARLRAEMGAAAVRAARSVGYVNAGTCEFMLDADGAFYFLEMNTRLQVEHPVTELAYGVDLVHWQLRIANGETLTTAQDAIVPRGWAIETRIYAEDPANHLLPSTGTITAWEPPDGPGIRVDAGVDTGSEVGVYYDPMLAKLIVWAEDRASSIERLTIALERFHVQGVRTNIPLLAWIARDDAYHAGDTTTSFLAERLDENQFVQRETPHDALALAAAAFLATPHTRPWRLGDTGIPLCITDGTKDSMLEASLAAPSTYRLSGALEGTLAIETRGAHVGATLDGRALSGTASIEGRRAQVRLGDASFSLSIADAPEVDAVTHAVASGGGGEIVSPMPGKIVKIVANEGASVEPHDLLLVLEAMKMEHRIEAPSAGTVRRMLVREGEIVSGGARLAEIE